MSLFWNLNALKQDPLPMSDISQVFKVDDIMWVWKDINKDYFLQLSAKQGL